MQDNLKKIIEEENRAWSKLFSVELEKKDNKVFASLWWQKYYAEIGNYLNNFLDKNNFKNILEAGSGSGKASLQLNADVKKTLLDISPQALEYAQYLSQKFKTENIVFKLGDIFDLPFEKQTFDLVWNIGVVEHYELNQIKEIFKELLRVCKKDGALAIGVPNLYSGPILKAWLLKKIKFVPGYRLNTEKFYSPKKLEKLLISVAQELDYHLDFVEVKYFGNPLIIETPKFILNTFGKIIEKIFYKNKFLIFIVCKFK